MPSFVYLGGEQSKLWKNKVYPNLFFISDWYATLLFGMLAQKRSEEEIAMEEIYGVNHWPAMTSLDGKLVPRKEIMLQIRENSAFGPRYALITQADNGDLWKYISGYEGLPTNQLGNDKRVNLNVDGHFAFLDYPLELTSPGQWNASILTRDANFHDCVRRPCLFNVKLDPSEMNNVFQPERNEEFLNLIEKYRKLQKQFYLGDELCDKGYFPTKSDIPTDERLFSIVKKCKAFLPYLPLDGKVKIPCSTTFL